MTDSLEQVSENDLLREHLPLARQLARRYAHRGVEQDDLEQVAALALLKAIRRFDPARGGLEQFASVTIRGELRRYFRDHGWTVRPPRRIQELRPRVLEAQQELAGRRAHVGARALAAHLDVSTADVQEVLAAVDCYRPPSLDDEDSSRTWDSAGSDASIERLLEWSIVRDGCLSLGVRDRHVLYLRFVEGLSQAQIGERVGVGQMQVSRDLRRVLGHLRELLSDEGRVAG